METAPDPQTQPADPRRPVDPRGLPTDPRSRDPRLIAPAPTNIAVNPKLIEKLKHGGNIPLPTANLQTPPPHVQASPPNLSTLPPNLSGPPPNLYAPPPNLNAPPPNLQEPPPNLAAPPLSLPGVDQPRPISTHLSGAETSTTAQVRDSIKKRKPGRKFRCYT